MKDGIHPDYKPTTIRCACGNVIETGSTKQNITVSREDHRPYFLLNLSTRPLVSTSFCLPV